MNKKELVNELSKKVGTTKKECEDFLDSFMEVVTDSLSKEETVKLMGFGTFKVQKRASRNGVNPQTGKKIEIPEKKVPKFNPGKDLRDKVE